MGRFSTSPLLSLSTRESFYLCHSTSAVAGTPRGGGVRAAWSGQRCQRAECWMQGIHMNAHQGQLFECPMGLIRAFDPLQKHHGPVPTYQPSWWMTCGPLLALCTISVVLGRGLRVAPRPPGSVLYEGETVGRRQGEEEPHPDEVQTRGVGKGKGVLGSEVRELRTEREWSN